jgi:hypothetical protein
MLIAGADRKNFDELKSELYPFTLEDLLNMKKWHSMNLVKTTDSYARFITALPPRLMHNTVTDNKANGTNYVMNTN